MTCACYADEDGRPPGAVSAQRLGGQGHQREKGEDEHSQHSAVVGMHSLLLHEQFGKVAAKEGNYRHNCIQGEDEALSQRR